MQETGWSAKGTMEAVCGRGNTDVHGILGGEVNTTERELQGNQLGQAEPPKGAAVGLGRTTDGTSSFDDTGERWVVEARTH